MPRSARIGQNLKSHARRDHRTVSFAPPAFGPQSSLAGSVTSVVLAQPSAWVEMSNCVTTIAVSGFGTGITTRLLSQVKFDTLPPALSTKLAATVAVTPLSQLSTKVTSLLGPAPAATVPSTVPSETTKPTTTRIRFITVPFCPRPPAPSRP